MARSRRAYRKARPTVRVGLPSRKRFKLKPAAQTKLDHTTNTWDEKISLLKNYRALGIVKNPNLVGARSSSQDTVQSESLQRPNGAQKMDVDGGSDVETDELKAALGKKRHDVQQASLRRLTKMQRFYVSRLILRHGNDYQAMSKDLGLNKMQHTTAALEKLCKRFFAYEKLLLDQQHE